jgi:VanZ family protein
VARVAVFAAVLTVLSATLLPSESTGPVEWDRVVCILCERASLSDALANLLLFLPLGAAFALAGWPRWRIVLAAVSLSLSVEVAQFVVPGRDPSLTDLVCNTLGAALGHGLVTPALQWVRPDARRDPRRSLAVAVLGAILIASTDLLLVTALPHRPYFVGSPLMRTSSSPLWIGGGAVPGESFQGRIDEVRVYRRARTPSEIEADMKVPVGAESASPDLVAAYGFEEGRGLVLHDLSAYGNAGLLLGATWTDRGKFGTALEFRHNGDAVMVPHSSTLDLKDAMTLEAWIYPTGRRPGLRAVLQKEVDTYFLLAGSRAGLLRPSGGGTFGWSTEQVSVDIAIPVGAWTHLAVTYDGGLLRLYIDGRLAAHRQRWYPGGARTVTLDGLPIAAGASIDHRWFRDRLLTGAPLQLRAIVTPVEGQVPLLTLHDAFRDEILQIAVDGEDAVFRLRRRASAVKLDSPDIRARGILHGLAPGDDLVLTLWQRDRALCAAARDRVSCGLGFSVGVGWGLLFHSQVPPGWPHALLNALWMVVIAFPFGFWMRPRWESAVGAVALAAGIVLPMGIGSLRIAMAEIAAVFFGVLIGWAAARCAARHELRGSSDAGGTDESTSEET